MDWYSVGASRYMIKTLRVRSISVKYYYIIFPIESKYTIIGHSDICI